MNKKPKIVIVAGGLATRMNPITQNIPKCLIDVNGTPLIEHQIIYFKDRGYVDFVFCVAHLAGEVRKYFGNGSKFGVNIEYSQEPKDLLGSAGAVKLIENFVDESIIIFYGDNLTSLDFDKMLNFHKDKKSKFTVFLRKKPEDYKGSSLVVLDDTNRIKTFIERPSEEELEANKKQESYINNGIYIMEPEIFHKIPRDMKYDFGKDLIPELLKDNLDVYGYYSDDFFVELGRVEKYQKFIDNFKGRKKVLDPIIAIFLDRDGVINRNLENIVNPDQFELLDGAPEAIKKINDSGFLTVIATNQPIISKGFLTFDGLNLIHNKMHFELNKYGAHIDAIYVCPHHPEKGFHGEVPELKFGCNCRKPKPGLVLNAIKDLNIEKTNSWMIGDSMTDIIAGKKAGLETVLLSSDGEYIKNIDGQTPEKPDFIYRNLLEAIKNIL